MERQALEVLKSSSLLCRKMPGVYSKCHSVTQPVPVNFDRCPYCFIASKISRDARFDLAQEPIACSFLWRFGVLPSLLNRRFTFLRMLSPFRRQSIPRATAILFWSLRTRTTRISTSQGKAITVTSGAKAFTDPAVASTIINGTKDGPVVVFATNETAAATLNGMTVQNGHSAAGSGVNGGGISISGASPTITNNVVTNNVGCGVFVYNAGGRSSRTARTASRSETNGSTCRRDCFVRPVLLPFDGVLGWVGFWHGDLLCEVVGATPQQGTNLLRVLSRWNGRKGPTFLRIESS